MELVCEPEKKSVLAATKGWKYLLAGQTECKILLKLKKSTEVHDLSSRRTEGI